MNIADDDQVTNPLIASSRAWQIFSTNLP